MPPKSSHLALVRDESRPRPNDGLSTSDVVDGLRAGEPEARDQLYRLYATRIWRFLVRIMGSDPDLEDLHHEVFLQAIRSAHRYDDRASVLAWLKGIAVNCARNLLRSRRRKRWLRFFAPSDLPERAVFVEDLSEEVQAVYRLLDRLPADERVAFTLRYFERMKVAEIADACDVSTGTIGRRLRRARAIFFEAAANDPVLRERCDVAEEEP